MSGGTDKSSQRGRIAESRKHTCTMGMLSDIARDTTGRTERINTKQPRQKILAGGNFAFNPSRESDNSGELPLAQTTRKLQHELKHRQSKSECSTWTHHSHNFSRQPKVGLHVS
jgi:hypothetical protein